MDFICILNDLESCNYDPQQNKTNKMACAPSEDSDQVDLSLHRVHMPFCLFCHSVAQMILGFFFYS